MWEEHPEYQKAQGWAICLLVLGLVLGGLAYALVQRDWPLLRIVLAVAVVLAIALVLFPLILKLVIKTITHLRGTKAKGPSSHEDAYHDATADSRRPFCLGWRWEIRWSLASSALSFRRLRLGFSLA